MIPLESRNKRRHISCIIVDGNHYSVPGYLIGQFIFDKIYPDKIIGYTTQKRSLFIKENIIVERDYSL